MSYILMVISSGIRSKMISKADVGVFWRIGAMLTAVSLLRFLSFVMVDLDSFVFPHMTAL